MSWHIALFIHNLGAGGAERVLTNLANGWIAQGHRVTMITLGNGVPFYPLDQRVQQISLNLLCPSTTFLQKIIHNVKRVMGLRKVLKQLKPDVAISFCDYNNILMLLASRALGLPVIISERNDPSQHALPQPWHSLRKKVYPWAHCIAVLTDNIAEAMKNDIPGGRFIVMPSPLPQEILEFSWRPDQNRKRLMAVGRLNHQKAFDRLIIIFSKLRDDFPDWDLWIWGEGEERPFMVSCIDELGLKDRVFLPGNSEKIWSELVKGDLFVLSSRYEGLPMALLEAMALGIPCVTYDCPSGPRQLTRDGQDGILVPYGDEQAMEEALRQMMSDSKRREDYGNRALNVRQTYSLEKILDLWKNIFINL